MTIDQQTLYTKIKNFELDDPTAAMTFTDRLARENGWTTEYTIRVVEEYKKFMFLLCITDHPLTPSDEIDQVWHLHLLYTQSYWIDFCQQTIGRSIHHGPTRGGELERDKYTNWYDKTKSLYQSIFNRSPPADIWPSSAIRFKAANFQRINRQQNWIIKKPFFFSK